MSREQQIQELTAALSSLAPNVSLSDDLGSDSSSIAASSKAVSSVATAVLEAAKNASEGSDGESDIWEPLLGDVTHEIGSWWFSVDGNIPAGGLPHLGHLVSRSTYGTGWTWIETNKSVVSDEEWLAYAESHNGTCPYYSYGDGSTTFRTPSYDQSFLKVLASISGAGGMEEAGLPNITGSHGLVARPDEYPPLGAFYGSVLTGFAGGNYKLGENKFDASRSNTIYGNSDTVTPQNYGIIVGIYLVGAVSAPIGETDAANLLTGITELEREVRRHKVALEQINLVQSGAYADGSQWYRKYADGWTEMGGTTTSDSVTFLRPFKDTNYTVSCTPCTADTSLSKTGHFFAVTKTPSGMTRTYSTIPVDWTARGYGEKP